MTTGSQISFTISLVFIALFTIAIISFSIGFANDNDAFVNIADDSAINSMDGRISNNMTDFTTGAEGTYASIIDTTVEPGSDIIQSSGPFAITPMNIIGVVGTILTVGYSKIFGSGGGFGIFLTTFLGLLTFVIALLIWKTWKGQP